MLGGDASLYQVGNATSSEAPTVVSLPAEAMAITGHPFGSFTCALLHTGVVSYREGQLGRGVASMRELPGVFALPCP